MVTTVGTESRYADLLTSLVQLEHDAIAAYESTVERLDDAAAKAEIEKFRGDHLRHMEELTGLAREAGVTPPEEGDMKRMLTTGKVAMADLAGDGAILRAMKTNEDDTVTAYERAKDHDDAPPAAREVFARALADEERHRAWMDSAASAR
jgi:rubrerythrin